jgi:hypothetical protein
VCGPWHCSFSCYHWCVGPRHGRPAGDSPGFVQTSAPLSFPCLSSVSTASGDCYTFGSNQHGQLGTSSRRVSRAPCRVQGLEGIKMVMVACGDAFTVAVGAGEGGQDAGGPDAGGPRQEYGGLYSPPSLWSCSCCPVFS